jgi:tetratricopeptide (TPR) repeat protein
VAIDQRVAEVRLGAGRALIGVALVAITWAAFHGALSHGFIDFDDPTYVRDNPHVQAGLSGESLAWALTSRDGANWHPVTWLSHMLDVECFGLDAGKHHRTNVALHSANVLLLFLLLSRMTGALWRPAFAAALFSIHPLHVESVAWIAERKDVLSTLFWLLTTAAWLHWLRSRTAARYALVVVAYALGLMAKPMLVTLPFTLLLLDVWPLARRMDAKIPLIREKAPLFAMSAASCVVTFIVQRGGKAVETLEAVPLGERVANALTSYVWYLGKTIWPTSLACFYPHAHGSVLAGGAVGSALVILALTVLAVRIRRTAPYVPVGWLWYLGTLVPVIGLIQVGGQARADRYTYVPLIGIFVVVAWGLGAAADALPAARAAIVSLSACALIPLFLVTVAQVRHWADNVSLFGRAVAATSDNPEMQDNLGLALFDRGETVAAIAHYREALRVAPRFKRALGNLGLALTTVGDDAGAISTYEQALAVDPDDAVIHFQLARALARVRRSDDAIAQYEEALRLRPAYPEAHDNLANLLADRGQADQAAFHYEESLRLRSDNPIGRYNFANLLITQDRLDEAAVQLGDALKLAPDFAEAHNALGVVRMRQGRNPEAAAEFREALRLRPDLEGARRNLEATRAP